MLLIKTHIILSYENSTKYVLTYFHSVLTKHGSYYDQEVQDSLAFIKLLYPTTEEDDSEKDQSLVVKLIEDYKKHKTNFARNIKFKPSSQSLSMIFFTSTLNK